MTVIHCNRMSFKYGVEFLDNETAGGFNTVGGVHMMDAVGGDLVRIDDGLEFVHGGEVDALGVHYCRGYVCAGERVFGFFGAVNGAAQAGNGLNDTGAAGGFDKGEEEKLCGGDVVFKGEGAGGAAGAVKGEVG